MTVFRRTRGLVKQVYADESLTLGLAAAIRVLGGALVIALQAWALGLAQTGRAATIVALGTIASAVDGGTLLAAASFPHEFGRATLRDSLRRALRWVSGALVVCLCVGFAMRAFRGELVLGAVATCSFCAARFVSAVVLASLQAVRSPRRILGSSVVYVALAATSVLILLGMPRTATNAVFLLAAATLIAALVGGWPLVRLPLGVRLGQKDDGPSGAVLASALFSQFDRVIVASVLGDVSAGLYAITTNVGIAVSSVSAAAAAPILSHDSDDVAVRRIHVARAWTVASALTILCGSTFHIWWPPLTAIEVPSARDSALCAIVLSSFGLYSLNAPAYYWRVRRRETGLLNMTIIVSSIVALLLILVGAAAGSLLLAAAGNFGYLGTLILIASKGNRFGTQAAALLSNVVLIAVGGVLAFLSKELAIVLGGALLVLCLRQYSRAGRLT
jgi:hypothetical protein